MGEEDEQHINIEKTDDEEEINARNEVTLEINDVTDKGNRNRRITMKSKDKDVDAMLPDAIKTMKEDFYENSWKQSVKSAKGDHIG